MSVIVDVRSREILDSRGNTVVNATNLVTFSIPGQGTGLDGNTGSSNLYATNGIAVIKAKSTKKQKTFDPVLA